MTTRMEGFDEWEVANVEAVLTEPEAEVNVFKPYRMKLLVHAAEDIPNIAPYHEESAGWLLDIGGHGEIGVKATVVLVDGV